MLLSVLVLGVCGLPHGAALHVEVDHENIITTNLTSSNEGKVLLKSSVYTLDEPISTSSGFSALWKEQDSVIERALSSASARSLGKENLLPDYVAKDAVMEIHYRGSREGWQSAEHAFDVKLPPQWQLGDSGDGYSVIFRDTKVNGIGIGSHFYQKLAILPKGETDKKKALFTVRMDTPHFTTGAKTWKIYKGYCTGTFPFLRCYGTGASAFTWREIYCDPMVNVVPKGGPAGAPMVWKKQENEMYMWSPKVPYRCSWNLPRVPENEGSTSPMFAEFFGGEYGDSNVGVEEEWLGSMDPTGIWKNVYDSGDAKKETGLFLTIATALQEAFKVGGSGN